jgi:hypothetical protein
VTRREFREFAQAVEEIGYQHLSPADQVFGVKRCEPTGLGWPQHTSADL